MISTCKGITFAQRFTFNGALVVNPGAGQTLVTCGQVTGGQWLFQIIVHNGGVPMDVDLVHRDSLDSVDIFRQTIGITTRTNQPFSIEMQMGANEIFRIESTAAIVSTVRATIFAKRVG